MDHWYDVAYAVGLVAAYLVISHEARWRRLDVRLLPNAMIVGTFFGVPTRSNPAANSCRARQCHV